MAWLSAHRFARIALAVVVLGSLTAVTFAAGYENSRAVLGDGSAYLQKEHSVVHVNGATGDVDAESARKLATGTQRLEVVQVRPGVVYVVNNETGEVFALPTETMKPEQIDKRPESSGRLQLESGGSNSYLVDAERGTASKLDGTGGPGSDVPIPARIDQLVVDGNGIGWAFAPESGELFQLNGERVVGRQRVAGLGERVSLSLVGNRPLLYRPVTGQAALYNADGLVRRFDLAAEGGIVAEPSNADRVVVFVPRTGEFVVADVDGGDIRRSVLGDRRGEHSRFGRPVLFHGRAYLPDYTFHHVVVVDLETAQSVAAEPVPGRSRPFDVFVRDNLLWASDPYDKTVITFDRNGLRTSHEGGGARPSAKPSTPPSRAPSAKPSEVPTSPSAPETMRVPNVVGDDRARACQRLRPLRCSLVAVPEGDGQTGIVLSTDPPAGSRVRAGSRVTVFYRGPAEVPNVVGMTATEACEAIRRAKLVCAEHREGTARTAAEAFVLTAQQPPAGARVNIGAEIVVIYPVNVLVPNVVGAALAQACATLELAAHGFRCVARNLGSVAGTGHRPGVIVAQRPAASAGAARGSDVQVDYYGNTTVPQLVGASPDAACAALAAASLSCTRSDSYATRQLGIVQAQSHTPGSVVPAGTAVTIAYETTGHVLLQRWKRSAPKRSNYLAAIGTGHVPPADWNPMPSSSIGVYLPGTTGLPGLWTIFRSRCTSGCGEIGGYYLSANSAVQNGYTWDVNREAFMCFDPATAPGGTRELWALFLDEANTWVWAVPGTGEWNEFHQVAIQYRFPVCRVW